MGQNNYCFEKLLNNAIKKCEGIFIDDFVKSFQLIYPFTTENISGYINEFSLKDRTLLTVGSSGDQIINSLLYGCKDVTSLDINPYTKFYVYLKLSCLLELEKEDFKEFLCFNDYPEVFKKNKYVFNTEVYQKIKRTLRLLDYESYLIWDELFQNFSGINIRENIFEYDENRISVIVGCNPYLQNDILYNDAREKVKKAKINFITNDLFKVSIDNKFDNIWLSNIGTYLSRHFVKKMADIMSNNLENNGKLLISYLYKTTHDTKYQEDWSPIYNLEKTINVLKQYSPYLVSFIGVDGIKFNDDTIRDSVLIYKK